MLHTLHSPPIVEVTLWITAARLATLKAAGEPIPRQVNLEALVDTGCTFTMVDPHVIALLGVEPTGEWREIHFIAEHPFRAPVYEIAWGLRAMWSQYRWLEFNVVAAPVMGVGMYIGRDALSGMRFIFEPPSFSLEFK